MVSQGVVIFWSSFVAAAAQAKWSFIETPYGTGSVVEGPLTLVSIPGRFATNGFVSFKVIVFGFVVFSCSWERLTCFERRGNFCWSPELTKNELF